RARPSPQLLAFVRLSPRRSPAIFLFRVAIAGVTRPPVLPSQKKTIMQTSRNRPEDREQRTDTPQQPPFHQRTNRATGIFRQQKFLHTNYYWQGSNSHPSMQNTYYPYGASDFSCSDFACMGEGFQGDCWTDSHRYGQHEAHRCLCQRG